MMEAADHHRGIATRFLLFTFCVVFWAGNSLRGADVPQLRKQLAVAEEANDNPAIIELNRRIVAQTPSDTAAWEEIARTQIEIKDYDRCAETLAAWQKAVKQPPAVIEDLRGDLAFYGKDYENAEKHWSAFLARKPSPADAAAVYDDLAGLCVEQSRWIDGAAYGEKAIAAKDLAARRVFHACALLRLHQWDAAYAEINKANKMDPSDAEVKEWLPQFERLQEFLPRIKALDAQIAKSTDDPRLLLERARAFTLAQRPLLALDDCQRVMTLQPNSMRGRIQTAEALQDAGQAENAAKLQVSARLFRGEKKHVSEQALRELADEDALILQGPAKAEPLVARAKTLRELLQFHLALADARAAVALDDKSAAAHLEAAFGFEKLDNPKEALAHVVKVTELNPADAFAWYYRGVLEAERANFSGAIESQTRSLKIRESLEALREREKCARRIGNVTQADADLKRIRELDPLTP